ncbi:Crp/Fnr family transcriptional regulator [Nonomuraea sp. NPDC047529]|uniref:Crp/Fnr family transcriptional regulator n=1 Tax=Nonomuraea sp. NPDC047529 TaxID=3155623 RepID=UPI0034031124
MQPPPDAGGPSASSFAFWESLQPEDRDHLESVGHLRRFQAGSILMRSGDPAEEVLVVRKGVVRIYIADAEGHEVMINVLGVGAVVGSFEAVEQDGRIATAQAINDVVALSLTIEQFVGFLNSHTEGWALMCKILVGHIRQSNRARLAYRVLDARQRLALSILDNLDALQNYYDESPEEKNTLPFSQNELAGIIGASLSTVAHILAGWRKRGIVRTRKNSLVVDDTLALRKIAGNPKWMG